ncbi:MAG: hypothetical protein AAFR87_22785 [Bacteroidota bacterium]
MRNIFTLLITLAICTASYGQSFPFKITESSWYPKDFDGSFVRRNNIKAINVKSFPSLYSLNAKQEATRTFLFDEEGQMIQFVELGKNDTSQIREFDYNDRGVLRWELKEDKIYNKSYKAGYRFDGNKNIYQVKNYEMINKDDVMLIESRRYIYNADSQLVAIKFLQNNQVKQVQKFTYDELGRTTSESEEDAVGAMKKKVSYAYNEMDLLVQVKTETGTDNVVEYNYVYNVAGNPIEAEWKENGVQMGVMSYVYDKNGMLVQMNRVLNQAPGVQHASSQVFEYIANE